MATANFHARLERIERAQASVQQPAKAHSIRDPGMAGIKASLLKKQRHPIREHFSSVALGFLFGCLVAIALIGLTYEGSPWGPGTEWNDLAFYPIMGALCLAPVLMIISVFIAARRPGFALFSLGYLSGVMIPMLV